MRQAQGWLSSCLGYHPSCRRTSSAVLPSRVLRIVDMNHVYLHEIADDEAGIYACLSHRWGNQTVLKTTSATLQDYKKNIPWAELPKTFQDAMSFTFRLGIGHLWIDSLCILQDSAEDWRHEGSMMSKIYEGSYVTLAATVAADASEGLFRTSSPDSMYQSFDYTRTDGQIYDVKCRSALTHWSISTNPLIQRPWVSSVSTMRETRY